MSASIVFAAGAQNGGQNSNGQLRYSENEQQVTNQWRLNNGNWCYMGNDGSMARNMFQYDSCGLCYLDNNGYLYKAGGWIENMENHNWCYLGTNGYALKNTWMKDSNGWCYLGDDCNCVINGWAKDSNGWCYIGADGHWDGKTQVPEIPSSN